MPTTYQQADAEAMEILRFALAEWHQPLVDAGVRIGVLMASNPEAHAVMHGGYPAAAKVRIIGLKDRVLKPVDAEILIDRHEWQQMQQPHRVALIDHELTHLELVEPGEDDGPVALDDLGRPRLRTRKGDWNGGDGFAEVVARHGDFSTEAANSRSVASAIEAAKRGESE